MKNDNTKYFMANPNYSAGRDLDVVEKINASIKDIDVKLVKSEPEADFNRTVLTIVGEPEPLKEAIVTLIAKCAELIDMREQTGDHPRMGAMDVIPIFTFKNTTIEEACAFTREVGEEAFKRTGVPIFFSGSCATTPEREALTYIRKGQYEGLKQLLKETKDDPSRADEYNARKPDLSTDGLLSEKAGGTVLLPMNEVAAFFNVFLDTEDVEIAKKVADSIRRVKGGFSTVTAMGTKFPEHRGTVVSLNVMDTSKTPIYRPFEMIKYEAERYGARVIGSELVGIVRLNFIVDCAVRMLQLENFKTEDIVETSLM